jgi:TonB family protein
MLKAVAVFLLATIIHSASQAVDVRQTEARPSTHSGGESTAPGPARQLISNEEESELRGRLKPEPETHIAINYWAGEPPASILEAKVSGVKRDRNKYGDFTETMPVINDYAMRASFSLINNTRSAITELGLRFKHKGADLAFCVYKRNLRILPDKESKIYIDFMLMAGDPADLIVDIVGAKFEDGRKHGFFPDPPALLEAQPSKEDVDSGPKPLNAARPAYTELARLNGVQGTVRLSLLVGTGGAPKAVNVINPLPDGLTEEAIRAVYKLRFDPARKNGEPVESWINIEIDFNLTGGNFAAQGGRSR